MSSLLQQLNIFELRPLVTNFNCKLSTITDYDARKQLLCLVSEENDVVLRYTSDGGQEVLKLISWFRRTNRVIHDVCFDPSGTWLLVLCFDNTLHIVPALAVVDKTYLDASNSYQPQPYSHTQVTSYIIPFVGPHECPNSKKCPNRTNGSNTETTNKPQLGTKTSPTELLNNKFPTPDQESKETLEETKEQTTEGEFEIALKSLDDFNVVTLPAPEEHKLEAFSHDMPTHMLALNATPHQNEDNTGNSHVMATSFMASKTCPYPLSVVWWQTIDGMNRAIIGYSDGSICFVGLSPNCPFVASTTIQSGSVVKLLICKDITFESVMLLITSSLKQQFKLLLEQKTIKYVYPGDSSPSANQSRENDWQIVMPLKTNSNCSDPASDSSQLDEDVFIKNEDLPNMATSTSAASTTVPANTTALNLNRTNTAGSNMHAYANSSQLPPPPPYSVAINRHVESAPLATVANMSYSTSTTSTGVRFQQQQLPDLDDINGRAGILPAARARLASLKSLGSKKLNAIKMRLSDNRQKLEEYIPENTIGSFAIMDSPSLKPEILSNSIGSFYTIQNLRSTYLLSALHCQSNRLSVHSIDINLKPLFLYKIPKNCFDILISSNILYSIQYVDIKGDEIIPKEDNTEKENRDTEIEKEEKYADEKLQNNTGLSDISEKIAEEDSSKESFDTSATSSEPSAYECMSPSNSINSVGVISSAMASLRTGDEDKYNTAATLAMFRFEHETVLNLYQMATYRTNELNEVISKEEKAKAFDYKDIRSPMDYVNFYETADIIEEYSLRQMEIMQTEFPKINYDPCYVVTNKNVYYIHLKKEPFAIFLDAALAGEWMQCREFCNTFDLTYETCIEFAGDYLLRRKRVTQALVTYNNARIKPIRTALKLAMFGQTNALMHLCAMALKATYLLKGTHFSTGVIKGILSDITYRHSEDVRNVLPTDITNKTRSKAIVNEGALCSNYVYGVDESISNLQMSPSSQFHLANLLLITLAEKAVNDKNYLPLWNFIVTNNKYHANMTSIVLCQSGLYSSALLLAKTRGVCIDTFLALTSVVGQEFGWYTELNVCLYNLSEDIFTETITYMPQVSVDYFLFIQEKLKNIRGCVLRRLQQQLNPFSAILRPIVSHTSSHMGHILNDNNTYLFEFCKNLIETYIAVLIHIESQRSKADHITNALSTFRLNYEDNQFAIESSRFKPISAGCAHCACIVDGIAYFWGSNGVPCNYNVNKSSDPPDPPHAVKSLDLLSQLNLEVHAVKCGRQHTLVLTNNGLYTFGNNNYSQLGIGNGMQMSLQPMLVKAFDGKNITILEAGQYHNAAVADGLLYTWGWGIYGQLGHGDTESIAVPKIVSFFKYKKVVQVSLGHAHTLVLCQSQQREIENQCNELYVFGSNHFGQLGLGAQMGDNANPAADDDLNCATQVKSLIPIKLDISDAKIRLIHTKFFTNLAVDENNRMFTWGSSPQALRLANQIKRRANAKQKMEENQRREISKRFEATLSSNSGCILLTKPTETVVPVTMPTTTNIDTTTTVSNSTTTIGAEDTSNDEVCTVETTENENSNSALARLADMAKAIRADELNKIVPSTVDDNSTLMENRVSTAHISDAPESDATISIEIISEDAEEFEQPSVSSNKEPFNVTVKKQEEALEDKNINTPPQKQQSTENDPCEHMSPHLVDTTEVAGEILQISSGLFHFALISSTCTLYTWGKNLEHQLGTEDKERRTVIKPLPVDSIESPMYVDCGADFTVVMTTEHIVKAFGGNSNGQCGRDLGTAIDRVKQRVVCLPTTKRLMRFESQCVEIPVEINLPRPRIRLDTEPVRYLKSIPDFQPHFVQEADINIDDANFEQPSPSYQYKSTTQADSSEKVASGQDSDDLISSLENISNNDVTSANISNNASPVAVVENEQSGSYDFTPEEQSYARLATTEYVDHADQSMAAVQQLVNEVATNTAIGVRTAQDSIETEPDSSELQLLRNYIHYCLYVFHGLYNPDKVRDFAKERREYRVRTCMLNFKFVDAFVLCLQDCDTANKSLKIFEYFTKDTSFVPMHRQDLKYLVYYLMLHFLERKFDMLQCERFFLADLDFYLLELAYVLYFNNNNTVLEQTLNQKLKNIIAQEQSDANKMKNQNNEQTHKLEYTDALFDNLSVKFKTIICQRLVKYCESNIC